MFIANLQIIVIEIIILGNNIQRALRKDDSDMERTFLGLIIKILATFIAAWIAYGLINNNALLWIFIVALTVAIVNYLIGDLLILPRYGNAVATVSDGIMAVIVAFIIDLLTVNFNMSWVSGLVFLITIAVFEYFLHKYITVGERAVSR